jgi:hypothetical protein
MAPNHDEGVSSLSFSLEGIQQVVPYEYIRELLVSQKGVPKLVDVPEGMLDGSNKEILSGTPSSKCFTHACARGFWGE